MDDLATTDPAEFGRRVTEAFRPLAQKIDAIFRALRAAFVRLGRALRRIIRRFAMGWVPGKPASLYARRVHQNEQRAYAKAGRRAKSGWRHA